MKNTSASAWIIAAGSAACGAIGLAMGVAFGPIFNNLGVGIGIGTAIGAGIGMSLEQRFKDNLRPLTGWEKNQQKWGLIIGLALVGSLAVILTIVFFVWAG